MVHEESVNCSESSERGGKFVLVFSGTFLPGYKGGGPVKSVARVLDSLESARALLVTSDRDLGDERPYDGLSNELAAYGRHRVFYFNHRSVRSWIRLAGLVRARTWAVVYVNSYWSPLYTVLPLVLRASGALRALTVLLAPRGSLGKAALEIKPLKKAMFLPLFRFLMRWNDVVFHVSSAEEEGMVLSHHPWARVVNVPPPHLDPTPHAEATGRALPRVVYISRIAPIKNLHLVLEALKVVDSPFRLEIYGPVEDQDYWSTCASIVDRPPSGVVVEYMGALAPAEVTTVLRGSDIFVLPTAGENYGHSIAEALAAGCSVAIPDTTPWTDIVRDGAGEVIDGLNAEAVARALSALLDRWNGDSNSLTRSAELAYRRWLSTQSRENPLDAVL